MTDIEQDSRVSFKKANSILRGDDPFLEREGKTLKWSNVNMTVAGKKGKGDKVILKNVWGEAPKREITAIMGPSGSGKTSLLNILAGRLQTKGALNITSDIRLDTSMVDPTNIKVRKQIAFVAQDDSLPITSTPRECIKFSAKLRLPKQTTAEQIDVLTDRMLKELGLENCADTYVGGALLKGISGGERKRTSVGVELVVRPSLVFLDEPTSGLDSYSAEQVVLLLKKVAKAGTGVLFTIHQPSSQIFNSFDHLILLNSGQIMYQGEVEDIYAYFEQRGQPVPEHYNPSDWIMDVAQRNTVKELDSQGFFLTDERALETATEAVEEEEESSPQKLQKPGFLTQIKLLYKREALEIKRNVPATGARFGITIFINILMGLIFKGVGSTDAAQYSNLQSRFGAVVMIVLNIMFGTAQPALMAFPEDRPVFLREYTTNHYRVISYFLARFTSEAIITFLQVFVGIIITFFLLDFQSNFFEFVLINYAAAMASTAASIWLGCSIEDPQLGIQLLPMLFVPQMLFAGFFVSTDLLPVYIRWAQYLCPLTYALRLLNLAEFGECAKGNDKAAENCRRLFEITDVVEEDRWWYWLVMLSIFLGYRLGGLIILKQKSTKFY